MWMWSVGVHPWAAILSALEFGYQQFFDSCSALGLVLTGGMSHTGDGGSLLLPVFSSGMSPPTCSVWWPAVCWQQPVRVWMCLGTTRVTAFFRFMPLLPSSLDPGTSELCVGGGGREVGHFSLMEGWPLPWGSWDPALPLSPEGGVIYGRAYPLHPLTLAMNTLQFSEISTNCHEPILRKGSHQMFI